MKMKTPPDIEGVFHLASDHRTVVSGYRPEHTIHENYQTSGEHTYLNRESVGPGESANVEVRFLTPEVYPRCIWEGRVVSVQEGARVVGTLKVTRICNESLRVAQAQYKSQWVEPAGLRGEP